MTGYHCTTPKKLARYAATGGILPPVRFWRSEGTARDWMSKTSRSVLLKIEVETGYPLPDHKPRGMAWWSPEVVRGYLKMEER